MKQTQSNKIEVVWGEATSRHHQRGPNFWATLDFLGISLKNGGKGQGTFTQ